MENEQENFKSWDFKESDTKEFTHCIHTYPAMMIPQIARRLIYLYGKESKTLLDPFMGSGTSLVEASLVPHIKEAYGFDLNPLAYLISKVKTTPINLEILEKELPHILNTKEYEELPKFKNLEFWFKPKVIENLAILKTAINKIPDNDTKDFFKVVLSETIRNVSNTRNSEFKLYRMEKEKLEKYNPNVFLEFEKIAKQNINGMKEYIKVRTSKKTEPKLFSSMDELPIKNESIDIIVTSQFTPLTPLLLLVSAPIVPATWVPWLPTPGFALIISGGKSS